MIINPEFWKVKKTKFYNKQSSLLLKILKKEKVPRKKVADGINSKLYKRFGWEPGDNKLSENEEMYKRLDYVKSLNPMKKNLDILITCISKYDNYLKKNEYFT